MTKYSVSINQADQTDRSRFLNTGVLPNKEKETIHKGKENHQGECKKYLTNESENKVIDGNIPIQSKSEANEE